MTDDADKNHDGIELIEIEDVDVAIPDPEEDERDTEPADAPA